LPTSHQAHPDRGSQQEQVKFAALPKLLDFHREQRSHCCSKNEQQGK
jgi:hypothetical protein